MPDLSVLEVNGVAYDLRDPTKAPSGYGLGEYPSTVITNPDTITKNGYYKAVCTFSEHYQNITAWVEMIASSENYATQHAYFDMHGGGRLTRYKIAGVWQPWEWNNPPMGNGIEFRTTERYMGKAVYTLLVDLGTLPVSENKYVYPSIPNNATIVSIAGIATDGKYSYPFPLANANGVRGVIFTAFDANNQFYVCVRANQDCSALTAKVEIKYTKD